MSSDAHGGALDRARLESLYVRLEAPMYNVVYRWVWNADDAHEIVQEAFARLWQMRDRVDVERVEPLVYRIALNHAANVRRWKKLRSFIGLDQTAEPAAEGDDPETRQRRQRVRAAVERLPDGLRRVVLLVDLAGMSYQQVAETLDIKPGTVGSRRNKALALLRAELGEWQDDDEQAVEA